MDLESAQAALSLAKLLQLDANEPWLPPAEVLPSRRDAVVPSVLFRNSRRGYLINVVHQINTTYENTCYDACAVMVRRLVETLIVETFVAKVLANEIKDVDDNFLSLSQLIAKVEPHTDWHLSRNTKQALKRLKELGGTSAHNRVYSATRHDIDDLIPSIRVFAQEFLVLANLR